MKVVTQSDSEMTVASRIAGEDIARGDFVAVISEITELPSFYWNGSAVAPAPEEPVRVRYLSEDAGQPYRVIGVCLPFVYVKSHTGAVVVIDTRRRQLVRLNRECARIVWKEMKLPSRKIDA
ncbi:MAG: hypothetical protein FJ297_16560 [Planctomycetes bacterium]|nr:hypothetical protein [Planctomycetota bacterium]